MEYEDCDCVNALRHEDREKELIRVINTRIFLQKDTETILILSHLDFAKIGINSILYEIKRGLNKICYCAVRKLPYKVEFSLSNYFLTFLTSIPCNIPKTEVFSLKGRGHMRTCEYSQIPSLQTFSYFANYSKGLVNKDLKTLAEKGELPWEVFYKRPESCCYRTFVEHSDLIHMPSGPFLLPYMAACEESTLHLYNILDRD
jgi:hypothetical protein